jgi:hypothetical protein
VSAEQSTLRFRSRKQLRASPPSVDLKDTLSGGHVALGDEQHDIAIFILGTQYEYLGRKTGDVSDAEIHGANHQAS